MKFDDTFTDEHFTFIDDFSFFDRPSHASSVTGVTPAHPSLLLLHTHRISVFCPLLHPIWNSNIFLPMTTSIFSIVLHALYVAPWSLPPLHSHRDIRLSPSPPNMEFEDTYTDDDFSFFDPFSLAAAEFIFDDFDRPLPAAPVVAPPTFTQSRIASGPVAHPLPVSSSPAGAAMSPPKFVDMNLSFTPSPDIGKVIEDQYICVW